MGILGQVTERETRCIHLAVGTIGKGECGNGWIKLWREPDDNIITMILYVVESETSRIGSMCNLQEEISARNSSEFKDIPWSTLEPCVFLCGIHEHGE